MFRKLKRKFIIVYTLSIVVLIIFFSSIIFYTSYESARQEIVMQLQIKDFKPNDHRLNDSFYNNVDSAYRVFGEDIYILLNDRGQITETLSQDAFNNDEIMKIQKSLDKGNKSIIKIDDDYYAYAIYGNLVKLKNINHFYIALRDLLFNLVIFGILMIIFAIALGNVLSLKALVPIKRSYDKQKAFVSDASHELKTPLSVISSCLDLIKEGDDESEKWIDYCISETNRLKTLTSTLLTLSKDLSDFEIQKIPPINISEQVDLLICAYEVNLFEKNFKLETDIEQNIEVRMLEDDFKQMFHILMDNAIKYNDKRKTIKIKLKNDSKYVELIISNGSEFVENKEIEKIFDRFYRQDTVRSKRIEGFGLGLALVKSICMKYKIKYGVKYEGAMMNFYFHFNKL